MIAPARTVVATLAAMVAAPSLVTMNWEASWVARFWRRLRPVPEAVVADRRFGDWPSMFQPQWVPDKQTANRVGDRASRFTVRLASWGEPVQVFEQAVPDVQELLDGCVEVWDWVQEATARWDDTNRRILMDVLVDVEPDDTLGVEWHAEHLADYVDRWVEATVGEWEVGQTAIVDVF